MKYYIARCKCNSLLFDSTSLLNYQCQVVGSEHTKTDKASQCCLINGQIQVDCLLNTVYIAPPEKHSINSIIKCNSCNSVLGEIESGILKFNNNSIKLLSSRFKSNLDRSVVTNLFYTDKMISLQEELLGLIDEYIESKPVSEVMTKHVLQ